MTVPENLKYTKDHEWVKVEGNIGTIGITDYAQNELGDIVYIDINSSLSEVKSGDAFGTVEAVKTVSDLYAPCSGKIVEINQALNDNPQSVNSDPYNEGWMIKIELSNINEIEDLLDSVSYKSLIGQ